MDEIRAPTSATPRRRFLRLLALAPAAAACASAGAARTATPPAAVAAGGAAGTASPAGPDPLAPIRDFPLAAGSEPAFVFRAASARPRI